MEAIFDLIVLVGIIIFLTNVTKKGKKQAAARQQSVPNQPRKEYTKPAKSGADIYHKAQSAASGWKKSLYEADRDSQYDRHSLDYCDSDVPTSEGITFRDLPEGTDELAYLHRWNKSREHLLEQSLESRE